MSESKDSPAVLWSPSKDVIENSNLRHYQNWLSENKGIKFADYRELWNWSINSTSNFWETIWEYFEILHSGSYTEAHSTDPMPFTKWFDGTKVNYAEHIFRNSTDQRPAIIFKSENSEINELTWRDLEMQVAGIRDNLIKYGIEPGDRVVGWLPNIPEAIIAFLAVNSIGAVWSSTSPDFGIKSVIDRFAQIEPKVLITANGYSYNGKIFDKMKDIEDVQEALPTVKNTIIVSFVQDINIDIPDSVSWDDCLTSNDPLIFTRVPFESPIWILYSSGTTGLPKAITHSYGGTLLEHLKYLTFHNDVKPGDNFFWFTTTGWMMWNYQMASMLCGASIVLYEGSPSYPDINTLWDFAQNTGINHFGTSAAFITANMKAGTTPGIKFNLSKLKSIGSTGAPLPPESFDWIYKHIDTKIWLTSISGGSDVCSAFVGGNPLLPVFSGEIQCRALGCALFAYDDNGQPVIDEVGEMVITKPMPSMPIFFWNDPIFTRYKESYFEMFPNVWRHGDWTRITPRDSVVIYGRSDATLNRGGVRIGTAEIYSATENIEEVLDSIIICIDHEDGSSFMPLFVVSNQNLTDELIDKIKKIIRTQTTPRHVPDQIIQIDEVPYTISGKKTEAPVKRILMGKSIDKSINKDALKNPSALDFFIEYHKNALQ